MEVLWIDSNNIMQERIIRAMERKKWNVTRTGIKYYEAEKGAMYLEVKKHVQEKSYFLCFSIDFITEVARACYEMGIKYAAWMYDLTSVDMYSPYAFAAITYLFIPDYSLYKKLVKKGYPSVYYLPWGTEIQESSKEYMYDLSFAGSLYGKERQEMNFKMEHMEEYVKGYLTALMKMQSEVCGEFFVESMLDKRTVESLKKIFPCDNENTSYVSEAWYYANSIIAKNITGEIREKTLKELAKERKIIWYSKETGGTLQGIQCNGTADSYSELTSLYKRSRINLNMTFRSMESGIPIQALDIMGSGGFLLTNYQDDFQNFFVPGEDYVYYSSTEELLMLVRYYLENEEERCRIAKQGYEKVKKYHTYDCRIESVIQIMFNKEELQLLAGIKELEDIRRGYAEGSSRDFDDLKVIESMERMRVKTDEYFEGVEIEREIRFLLKGRLMEYIDRMMQNGNIASWEKMILWYNRIGTALVVNFWEIFVWHTMLLIYSEEVDLYRKKHIPISVLQLRSMDEVAEVYFKTIFLLRRLEYGIEPMDEIIDYINEKGLSYVFIKHMIQKTQIEDKEQIMKAIEGIWPDYGSR